MNADQIIKKICHVVVLIFAIKFLISMGTFDTTKYKGTGYTIMYPEGWLKAKESTVDIGIYFMNADDQDVVTFYPPDTMSVETGLPDVHMTVVSGKLENPSWIQDLWPDIMKVMIESRARIIDRGEIKINGAISKWILFLENGTKNWRLEFYFCDEKNGFFKIIYSGNRKDFKDYRKVFETAKDTFMFKIGLF